MPIGYGFCKIVSASDRSDAATTRLWSPVPIPIDLSWSPDSVTFNFFENRAITHRDRWYWWGGRKVGYGFGQIVFLLPIVLAPQQRVDDHQYHNRSIRLNLQIVIHSFFLNIGQELTEIGDVDDWWEGGHGGGFLGKITRWCASLFLVPHRIRTKG